MGKLLKRISAAVRCCTHYLSWSALAPSGAPIGKRALWTLLICTSAWQSLAFEALGNSFVRMDFSLSLNAQNRNTVFIELFDDRPLTRDNFLAYVNGGAFDEDGGTLMHRLVQGFVLQGGGFHHEIQTEPDPLNTSLNPNAEVDLDGNPATPNPSVNNEFSNQPFRSNLRGTLAMAKVEGNPNSATSEFFFNLKDNGGTSPNGLDFQNGGFTVFARVVGDGMALIDAYNGLPDINLNQDSNDNGVRDAGPFTEVPILPSGSSYLTLIMTNTDQIDYLGNGLTTTVPAGGLTFSQRDTFIDTGTVFTGSIDPLTIGPGRKLGIRENYSLNRSIMNHGILAPGLDLGAIVVQGNYYQFADGTLDIELRETIPGSQYDKLIMTNDAFLNGKLNVSLIGGFEPGANDSFTVLTCDELVGDFAVVDLPQLTLGLVWDYARTAKAITISVAAADFNRNGVTDMADYVLWRNMRNATVTPFSAADGNGNGVVDDADFIIWRNNFGNTRGGSSGTGLGSLASVPEPGSLALLGMAVLPIAARRRRQRG